MPTEPEVPESPKLRKSKSIRRSLFDIFGPNTSESAKVKAQNLVVDVVSQVRQLGSDSRLFDVCLVEEEEKKGAGWSDLDSNSFASQR